MDGGAIRTMKLFENICGAKFLQNSVVITTMWDKYPEDRQTNEQIERQLINEYWCNFLGVRLGKGDARSVANCKTHKPIDLGAASNDEPIGAVSGAMYVRSDNKQETFEKIISMMIKKDRGMPRLQRELWDGKLLRETAAGQGLNTALDKLRARTERTKNDRRLSGTENMGSRHVPVTKNAPEGETQILTEYTKSNPGLQTENSLETTVGTSYGTTNTFEATQADVEYTYQGLPDENSNDEAGTRTNNTSTQRNGRYNDPVVIGQVRNPRSRGISYRSAG